MKRLAFFAAVLVAVLVIPLVAQAHSPEELEQWRIEWIAQVAEDGGVTPEAMAEWIDMAQRHGCSWPDHTPCPVELPVQHRTSSPARTAPATTTPAPAPPPATNTGMGSNVEQWRPLVTAYFGANADRALRVMACESGGNPSAKNTRSTAAGLFQFLRSTWDWVAPPLGYGSYDSGAVYNAEANIHAASVLSQGGSNWSHWVCKG